VVVEAAGNIIVVNLVNTKVGNLIEWTRGFRSRDLAFRNMAAFA